MNEEIERVQKSFFTEHGLARHTDPRTSKEAAEKVRVGPLQIAILRELLRALKFDPSGLTMNETVDLTGKPNESITPRFRPMEKKGLILDTGDKRRNPSGKLAIVWNITPFGLAVLEAIEETENS